MAPFSCKIYVLSALLVLVGTTTWVHAASDDDEATVETEEEVQYQYRSPTIDPKKVYLAESFDDENSFRKRWVKSDAKKQGIEETLAKYDGVWEIQEPIRRVLKGDSGLVLTTEAKHAAIATLLNRPFRFDGKPLVVQYEVTMQEGQNCGGAYLKLLSAGAGSDTKADLRHFHDQTPYTIMFGPDKCGNDNKLHFIFRHRNPKNGTIEEKHCKKPSQRLDDIYKDKEPHLYTLIVDTDNTFVILIDNKEVNSGSLLEDFTPPVNPPEEVDDPNDKKPDDWDEREKIVDPTARKPEDWDEDAPAQIVDPNAVKPDGWLDNEPEMIPDPEAVRPEDWDDDMDGEWEAPLIDNPACTAAPGCGTWTAPTIPNPDYKGVWRAPLIENPNYRGKWTPRRIPNPHFFKDEHPYKMTPIVAVGFELWSMSPRLLFDNLIVTDDPAVAADWAAQTFAMKRAKIDQDSASVLDRALQWAGNNPMVYVVIILVCVVIVALIAYCCCYTPTDRDEDTKKTDGFVEDDQFDQPSEGEAGDGEGEGDNEGEGDVEPRVRVRKADLEPAPVTEPESEGDAEADAEPIPDSTDDNVPLVDAEGGGDRHRRRKPRRE